MWTKVRSYIVAVSAYATAASIGASPAFGQANYTQSFNNNGAVQPCANGPQNLISQGWFFRDLSSPLVSGAWHDGYTYWFPPQAGAGTLTLESALTPFLGCDVSQWAILPAVPNLQAGDTVMIHAQRAWP